MIHSYFAYMCFYKGILLGMKCNTEGFSYVSYDGMVFDLEKGVLSRHWKEMIYHT